MSMAQVEGLNEGAVAARAVDHDLDGLPGSARVVVGPDGEATVVDREGNALARGHLAADLVPDGSATDKVGVTVRFVGRPVR
jgi:hypothetical protein